MKFLFERKFNLFDIIAWMCILVLVDAYSIWFLLAYIPMIFFSVSMEQKVESKL